MGRRYYMEKRCTFLGIGNIDVGAVVEKLEVAIKDAVKDGYHKFYCGFSGDWQMTAAIMLSDLQRKIGVGIELYCLMPRVGVYAESIFKEVDDLNVFDKVYLLPKTFNTANVDKLLLKISDRVIVYNPYISVKLEEILNSDFKVGREIIFIT
jgi:hypothetical protein